MTIVETVISEEEKKMPKVYTEKAYKEVLANNICNRHIEILKKRKQDEKSL